VKIDFAFLFKRSELKRRILLLAALGAWSVLFIVGVSDYLAVQQAVRQSMQERLALTGVVSSQIERLLKQNLSLLENVSFYRGFNLEDKDLSPEKYALHSASLQSICKTVLLLDPSGKLLWAEPQRNYPDVQRILPVREVLATRKPAISNLVDAGPPGKKVIFLIVPIIKEEKLFGLVAGQLDNPGQQLIPYLTPASAGGMGDAQIVDENGFVVASTSSADVFQKSEDAALLASFIQSAKSGIGRPSGRKDFLTVVPLSGISWAVVMRQSEKEVMAPVDQMKRRFFVLGSLVFVTLLVLTMGMAYSVIAPVAKLTESAKRIASGNLQEAVPISGSDEIGQLGKTLDEMRKKLRDAMGQIGAVNQELETRVDLRTREVVALCEELKRKEEAKGELLRKVISAQEEERKRIARELHDELSQDLAVLLLSLNGGDVKPSKTESMKQLVLRASDKVHQIMFDLRPSALDDLGLFSALKWYADERLVPNGIHVHFEGALKDRRLKGQTETALFRIAQEAITNIVRHSGAENVMISVEPTDRKLTLEIEDDGKGFEADAVSRPEENGAGLGLLGMKERALLLDGTFKIESHPGSGTRVVVQVPLEEAI
jgi:signal transduction histidine kinase